MKFVNLSSNDLAWPSHKRSSDFMENVFDDFNFFTKTLLTPSRGAISLNFQPSCDINEDKDYFMVSLDMPGVKKSDINIDVKGRQLIVSGERKQELKSGDSQTQLHFERSHGKFERSFTLPTSINDKKIEAHFENGVLNIALPKSEEVKPKKIQIKSGENSFFSRLLTSKNEKSKDIKDVKSS